MTPAMATYDRSLDLTAASRDLLNAQKVGLAFVGGGVLLFLIAALGALGFSPAYFFAGGIGLLTAGLFIYYARHIASPTTRLNGGQVAGLGIFTAGLLGLILSLAGLGRALPVLLFWGSTGLVVIGGLLYFWYTFARRPPGIRNDGLMFSSTTARGAGSRPISGSCTAPSIPSPSSSWACARYSSTAIAGIRSSARSR
jgi:hypothetical protein